MNIVKEPANERVDSASRVILASQRTLFRAFLDAEMLASWRAPEGMTASIERFDPRIGGGYRMILRRAADADAARRKAAPEDIADFRFIDLAPDDGIVEEVRFQSDDPALAQPMRLTTSFEKLADGTKVSVTAENVPERIGADKHKAGIASSLRNLARLTE